MLIAFSLLRKGSYTSPLTHSRCSITASFRATATTARFLPFFPPRAESFNPQRRRSLSSPKGRPQPVQFTVQVSGVTRELHPVLRDEAYRVAGEALRNAFRHAAQRIEVEIRYDERELRLCVRNDGKGIDPKLLSDHGRAGHFGLRGMKERATLAGGKLTVRGEP